MSDVTSYLQTIEDKIDSVTTCTELQALSDSIESRLTDLKTQIQDQIDELESLLVSPTSLGEVITWVNKMITMSTGPYNAMIAELTAVNTKTASILNKLTNKIATLGCDFEPPVI